MTDLRGRVKPKVAKYFELWEATVTYGYEGNYEHLCNVFYTWREAYDWAYERVKDWAP